MATCRILIVVSNPAVSTTTGWPVGFWAGELIHPYDAFTAAGHEVTIASPDGGVVRMDALSDPRDASGYSAEDTLSADYLARPAFLSLLAGTPRLDDLDLDTFDAIVVAGGQAPMFTFDTAETLHAALLRFHDAGKPTAALCHGVSALLHLRNDDGSPFLRGRTITGFTNEEEDQADAAVGQKLMPFRIEDVATEQGARFEARPAWSPFAMRDGHLITGQQQHSGGETARLVLETLKALP